MMHYLKFTNQMIDKELIQDVIDRILKYGDVYTNKVLNLNVEFPVEFKQVHRIGFGTMREYDKEKENGSEREITPEGKS